MTIWLISREQVCSERAFAGIAALLCYGREALLFWMKFTDLVYAEDFKQKDWNSTEISYLTSCLNLYDFPLEPDFLVKQFPEEGCRDGQGML